VVEIHFVHCGNGDTILLGIQRKTWVLIDCCLPKGPIRDHFFELVGNLGIQRLEAIFLTHPHEDHY
jgi:glyoxylase-like metal-dependent hydrolase (beta-lactamase superfamily II)